MRLCHDPEPRQLLFEIFCISCNIFSSTYLSVDNHTNSSAVETTTKVPVSVFSCLPVRLHYRITKISTRNMSGVCVCVFELFDSRDQGENRR